MHDLQCPPPNYRRLSLLPSPLASRVRVVPTYDTFCPTCVCVLKFFLFAREYARSSVLPNYCCISPLPFASCVPRSHVVTAYDLLCLTCVDFVCVRVCVFVCFSPGSMHNLQRPQLLLPLREPGGDHGGGRDGAQADQRSPLRPLQLVRFSCWWCFHSVLVVFCPFWVGLFLKSYCISNGSLLLHYLFSSTCEILFRDDHEMEI